MIPGSVVVVNPPIDTAVSMARPGVVGRRLRAIAERSDSPELAHLARECEALEDRVTYLEAARHHDRADLDLLLARLGSGVPR